MKTSRLKAIRLLLKQRGVDAVLISSVTNITYLTGLPSFSPLEREGFLLVTEKQVFLLTSSLYASSLRGTVRGLRVLEYSSKKPLPHLLTMIKKSSLIGRIGFEANNLTVSEWKFFKKQFGVMKELPLTDIRKYKDPDEIGHIAQASAFSDQALTDILPQIKPGVSEKAVADLIDTRIKLLGADIAFPTIVAFGGNAAAPHHHPDNTTLKKQDSILIDFGAMYKGYCSDMTRTVFIGKPTKEQQSLYDAVLASQQKAVTYIKTCLSEGKTIRASEVDQAARNYLLRQKLPSIPHSLGHGIGLQVHETPSLSPKSQDVLTEGMIFSIEPGVYFPGKIGIRIEDLYTIHERKLVQLTHYPSALTILLSANQ